MDITVGSGEVLNVCIRTGDLDTPRKHIVSISSSGNAVFTFEHGSIRVENDTVNVAAYSKPATGSIRQRSINLGDLQREQNHDRPLKGYIY